MLILNERAVAQCLSIEQCIAAVRTLFIDLHAQCYYNPLRQRFAPADSSNWMTVMPALRVSAPRRWCLKQMVVTPANSVRGLEPLQGVVLLQDGDDGKPLALVHVGALTAIRTAAVSAVASLALARSHPNTVTVLGTGSQGRAHLQAMRYIYPNAQLRIWGRNRDASQALAISFGAQAMDTIEAALADADVVCTVTAAREPIVRRQWFAPGAHVTAVGSSTRNTRELDGATLAAARLFVDQREAALSESGDILGALREGAITPEHIQAELGAVLAGDNPGRRDRDEFTLFKSLGFAALDLMAAELAMQAAQQLKLGVEVQW